MTPIPLQSTFPILGPGHELRPHRVQTDITHRADQVQVVQHHRRKAALEQVPGPATAGVNEVGIAPVRLAYRLPKIAAVRRLQYQVDMIGHQAVRPDGDAGLERLLGEQIEIDLMIAVLKEDGLAPVATLGYMMRQPRITMRASRAIPKTIAPFRGNRYHVPQFPADSNSEV